MAENKYAPVYINLIKFEESRYRERILSKYGSLAKHLLGWTNHIDRRIEIYTDHIEKFIDEHFDPEKSWRRMAVFSRLKQTLIHELLHWHVRHPGKDRFIFRGEITI